MKTKSSLWLFDVIYLNVCERSVPYVASICQIWSVKRILCTTFVFFFYCDMPKFTLKMRMKIQVTYY